MSTFRTENSSADKPRRHHRLGAKALAGAGALLLGVLAPAGVAFAATSSTSAAVDAGSLSVSTSGYPPTISVPVGGDYTGQLPTAEWSDTTGSGDGWNGTVAVSPLSYTGSWTQTSGAATALGNSSFGGAFDGLADGITYTVTVGSGGSGTSTPFTWTSNDPTDKAGGSGTATNGTAKEVGTKGITIDFTSGTTYPEGATYTIDAGTQSLDALSLDTAAGTVTAQGSTTSADPTLTGNGTTIVAGGPSQTDYGNAVTFVTAATGTGMGTYDVYPGVKVTADDSSWAATYTAGVEYSIVSGP